MAYIEDLVKDIEKGMSGKSGIYKSVKNDLTQEQFRNIREELKQIRQLLEKAKKDFSLEPTELVLSRIIDSDCDFIWSTIEDLWSRKLEKFHGKIDSQQQKDDLDAILKQLHQHATQIKIIVEK